MDVVLHNDGMQVKNSPATGNPMRRIEFGDLFVDVCDASGGIWFDLTEFGFLIRKRPDFLVWLEESVVPREQRAAGSSHAFICPNDNSTLIAYSYVSAKDVPLSCCPTCGGLWFDEAELERVLKDTNDRMSIWAKAGMPPEVLNDPEIREELGAISKKFTNKVLMLNVATAMFRAMSVGPRFGRVADFKEAAKKVLDHLDGRPDARLSVETPAPMRPPLEHAEELRLRESLKPIEDQVGESK